MPSTRTSRNGRVGGSSPSAVFLFTAICAFGVLSSIVLLIHQRSCLSSSAAAGGGDDGTITSLIPASGIESFLLSSSAQQLKQQQQSSYEKSYQSALLTLRCLTTPGCFPSLHCRTGSPSRVRRKKKWEEQAFCVEDLKASTEKNKGCLVYSFGIHTSWEWEEKMARLFGCQVHAFDPTMDHPTDLAPGVTFHKLGLQAVGTDMSATHSQEYAAIDPKLLLSLDQIMQQLGHKGKKLDVLMLDCEGCEWGVLRNMMCGYDIGSKKGSTARVVDQIIVEMHFQKNLGILNEEDVFAAAETVVCMEQERWGIVSAEASGIGKEDGDYERDVTKVLHGVMGGFLLNIALQRIPDDEPLPSERLEAIASHSKVWFRARVECENEYGFDDKKWPETACPDYRRLDAKLSDMVERYRRVYKRRVEFDKTTRIDEDSWKYPTSPQTDPK